MNFTQLPVLGPDSPPFCRLSLWQGGMEERGRESSEEEEEEGKAEEETPAQKSKEKLSA